MQRNNQQQNYQKLYWLNDAKAQHANHDDVVVAFDLCNNDHGLLNSNDSTTIQVFVQLFQFCKLINETEQPDNNDNRICLQAYKLQVIFWDGNLSLSVTIARLHKYLKVYQYYNGSLTPLMSALQYDLPCCNVKKPLQLANWQQLILRSGKRALQLFKFAPQVEIITEFLVPGNLQQLEKIARKVAFKNDQDVPALTDLCFQINPDQMILDRCLEISKQRKTTDNLPAVIFNGSLVGHPGYWLAKLPIDDPHIYFLGEFSNCCLKVSAEGEACIVDAVTRQNNGVYVLLKSYINTDSNAQEDSPPITMHHIDYQRVTIVGHGYAWIGEEKELVFDSWENRTPSKEDVICTDLLKHFAKIIVNDENLDIESVSIGTGSKTPTALTSHQRLTPARMLEGKPYLDAVEQSVIFCNEALRRPRVEVLRSQLQQQLDIQQAERLDSWLQKSCYSERCVSETMHALQFSALASFLKAEINGENAQDYMLRWQNILMIQRLISPISSVTWEVILDYLKSKKYKAVHEYYFKIYIALEKLQILNPPNLSNIISSLFQQGFNETLMSTIDALIYLAKADVNQKNYLLAAQYPETACSLKAAHEASEATVAELIGQYQQTLTLLDKHNLASDRELRSYCFTYPEQVTVVIDYFMQLKSMNLHQNLSLRQRILAQPWLVSNILNILAALQIIKNANMSISSNLIALVIGNSGQAKSYAATYVACQTIIPADDREMHDLYNQNIHSFGAIVVEFYKQFQAIGLTTNKMLRNWFFQNYQKIFYVLDIMRDIVHLATRPDFSCFSQKLMVNPADATGLKEAFLKLKTLGLSADKGILQQIYLNVPDAMQIVSSYYLLKAANLENNQAFRNIIGKNTADATHVIGDAIQKYKENYWPSFFKKTAAVTVVAGAAWMLTRHLTK